MDKHDSLADKKEIRFWLNALSNPHLDEESIALLNRCLQLDIQRFRIKQIDREVE